MDNDFNLLCGKPEKQTAEIPFHLKRSAAPITVKMD